MQAFYPEGVTKPKGDYTFAGNGLHYSEIAEQQSPRFIKTHFPIELWPHSLIDSGAKIVYVARNPKDVAVSFYHQYINTGLLPLNTDFESFAEYFMNDLGEKSLMLRFCTIFHIISSTKLVMWAPYWKHVLDAWNHRHHKNFHFMFYEDSQRDLESALKKLANFLEKPLKDKDLPKLMDYLQFDNLKNNAAVNIRLNASDTKNLLRRGKIGGNPEMTDELSKKFDEWTEKNLKGSDLKFPS